MHRVFVCNEIPEPIVEPLSDIAELSIWPGPGPIPRHRLVREVAGCDGILTMLTTPVDAGVLAASPELRVVSQMAVGVDNIDLVACAARRIQVGHTPGVLTNAVADTAFALLASVARRLPEGAAVVREGRWGPWDPWEMLGRELYQMTIGIVGMGRIGTAVAKRAAGFEMRVLYAAPSEKNVAGSERVEMDELLARSDAVVLAAPLVDDTYHLIDAEALGLMRPEAYLVNVARGGLIDTDALVSALESGGIAGAALDVTEPEPLPSDHPLLGLSNCLVVPHIGSASTRARADMAALAVENLIAGLLGRPMPAAYPLRE
ncbi:MAG: D-glycerate dehydrogenase [Acidobacteria bacterium]|nr:D-glycerate dehydrogenase [Acidobacteriota bacterium]